MNRLNTFEWVEHPLNTCECTWMPLSDCEQPLNTHWGHMSAIEWVWTPIECTWLPLSHYGMRLTLVWPWERSHLCQNWTHRECLWVHVNACRWGLNTSWTWMNACEWVGTAPEHPWVCIKAIESLLNVSFCGMTIRKISFVSELNMP